MRGRTKNRVKWMLLGLVLVFTKVCTAQVTAATDRKFPIDQLQIDLAFWRNRLETKHPLIYLYRTKSAVDHYFDSLHFSITRPMSELEFYVHIAPVSSFLKDGHNTIIPSQATMNEILETKLLLPFDLEYFDGRLQVLRNLSSNQDVLYADEIVAINGVEATEIQKELMRLVPQEGNNTQLAHAAIKDLFRFYYHIRYGFPAQHELTIRYSDDSEKTFIVDSRTLNEIRDTRLQRHADELVELRRGVFYREEDDGKNGVLTISTFDPEAFKRADQRFRAEIRGIFRQIKKSKTENLIIDLRDNAGGNPDFVKVLLKHLFDHRFEQAKEFRIVKHPGQEEFYMRTQKKWYPWFGIGKFSPAHNHFDGRIIVLHDENTFSAGVEVLSVLRKYDRATFMGTESGGNPIIMGGYIIKTNWELPNTKLQFSSGTHCTLFDDLDKNTGRGVIPDIEIERDLFDTLTNYDACLEFALDYLRKGKNVN